MFRLRSVCLAAVTLVGMMLVNTSAASAGGYARYRTYRPRQTVTTVLVHPGYPTMIGGWQMNPYLYPYSYPTGRVVLVPAPW